MVRRLHEKRQRKTYRVGIMARMTHKAARGVLLLDNSNCTPRDPLHRIRPTGAAPTCVPLNLRYALTQNHFSPICSPRIALTMSMLVGLTGRC